MVAQAKPIAARHVPITVTPWRQITTNVVRSRVALILAAHVLYDEPERSREIADHVAALTDWCMTTLEAGR